MCGRSLHTYHTRQVWIVGREGAEAGTWEAGVKGEEAERSEGAWRDTAREYVVRIARPKHLKIVRVARHKRTPHSRDLLCSSCCPRSLPIPSHPAVQLCGSRDHTDGTYRLFYHQTVGNDGFANKLATSTSPLGPFAIQPAIITNGKKGTWDSDVRVGAWGRVCRTPLSESSVGILSVYCSIYVDVWV